MFFLTATTFLFGPISLDYSSELVAGRYKKLLAGQLGNLLNRSTSVALNPSAKVPKQPSADNVHPDDKALHEKLEALPGLVDEAMANYRTTHATQAIFDMIAEVRSDEIIWSFLTRTFLSLFIYITLFHSWDTKFRPTQTLLTVNHGSWSRIQLAMTACRRCCGMPWSLHVWLHCSSSPSCPPRLPRFLIN
jgi:hypothetical protein